MSNYLRCWWIPASQCLGSWMTFACVLQEQCSFNGVWGGGSRHPTAFYVSSYFWDRATEAGIITDPKAVTWDMKIKDVRTAGDKACTSKLSAINTLFPLVSWAGQRLGRK